MLSANEKEGKMHRMIMSFVFHISTERKRTGLLDKGEHSEGL